MQSSLDSSAEHCHPRSSTQQSTGTGTASIVESPTRQRSGQQRNQPLHLSPTHRVAAMCSSSYVETADHLARPVQPKLRSLGSIGQQIPSDVVESTAIKLVLLRFPSCGMRSATELQTGKVGFRCRCPLSRSTYQSINQPNIARRALSFGVGRAIRRMSRKLGRRYRLTRSTAFQPKPCSTSAGMLAALSSTIQHGPCQPCF